MNDESRLRGAVLPLVLLLLVALTLVGHGALYLARRELEVARASVRDLRSRTGAEGAVRAVTAAWPKEAAGLLPVRGSSSGGTVEVASGVAAEVTIRRLARELYLVEGVGRQEGWPGRAVTALLVWVTEPLAVMESFGGVLQVGSTLASEPGTGIDGGAVTVPPDGWAEACEPFRDEMASLYPDGSLPGVERLSVPAEGRGLQADALLGPLTARDLVSGADRVPAGSVSPSPAVRLGTCAEEEGSWGSPADPGGPCGGQLPLVVARDALTIQGGEGQGILVVGGSLRLAAGARFWGAVLVVGDLVLEAEARIHGLVRVLGRVELAGGSQIIGGGCPALRALRGAPGLGAARPLPVRSWISPY